MDYGVRVERVQERMRVAGITSARQLASLAGVDHVSVSKLLQDNRPQISAVSVARLAAALLCSVDYLLGIVDEPSGTGVTMPEGSEELLQIIAALPLAKRVELMDVVSVMADNEERRRTRRFEEFEELAAQLRSQTTPGEYRTAMSELFRAARADDSGALAALAARYRLLAKEPDHQAEDV